MLGGAKIWAMNVRNVLEFVLSRSPGPSTRAASVGEWRSSERKQLV